MANHTQDGAKEATDACEAGGHEWASWPSHTGADSATVRPFPRPGVGSISVMEHLPSMREALGASLSTVRKNKNRKTQTCTGPTISDMRTSRYLFAKKARFKMPLSTNSHFTKQMTCCCAGDRTQGQNPGAR